MGKNLFTAKERAERYLAGAFEEPISILVWGSGRPKDDAPVDEKANYQKRLDIKESLRQKFTRCEVYFSEDPEMVEISKDLTDQLVCEALQAKSVDLVIVLDVSRGTSVELDHCIKKYSWFRDKVHVFLNKKYFPLTGLAKEILDELNSNRIQQYSQDDFSSCRLAKEYAVNIALTVATAARLES